MKLPRVWFRLGLRGVAGKIFFLAVEDVPLSPAPVLPDNQESQRAAPRT